MKRAGLLSLTMIAVLACGVVIAGCLRTVPSQPAKPRLEQPKPQVEGTKPTTAEPVVKIEAYYPFNPDHQYIVDYLREFEKKHQGQVKVDIYDMQSPEGRKKWGTTGLGCAGVFINGSTRHQITRNGKSETVDFLKRMDSFWAKEDFETVVNQLIEKAKTEK